MLLAIALSESSVEKAEADLLTFGQLQAGRAGQPTIRSGRDDGSAFEDGHHPRCRASDLPRHLAQGQSSASQTMDCSLLFNGQMWGHVQLLGSVDAASSTHRRNCSDPLNPPSLRSVLCCSRPQASADSGSGPDCELSHVFKSYTVVRHSRRVVQFRAEVIQFEFDSLVVVALSGELDLATAPIPRACLDRPGLHGTAEVEIDMAELTYLDSAGMSVLVEHWRDLNASGGSLAVFNASPMALKLFRITGPTPLLLKRAEDRLLPMPR